MVTPVCAPAPERAPAYADLSRQRFQPFQGRSFPPFLPSADHSATLPHGRIKSANHHRHPEQEGVRGAMGQQGHVAVQ